MASRPPRRAPFILGLTGPIACGKTTVGDVLLELGGVARIDADQVVHELEGAGTPVTAQIAERFGPNVLRPDGSVDRARLGAIVFGDAVALRDLEAIVHPAVRVEVRRRLEPFFGKPGVVVVDAVRLLQSDLLSECQAVWVVTCDPDAELRRLRENRGMSETDARARLAAQPSFDHPAVTRVIDNSGSLDDLRRQVQRAWRDLPSDDNEHHTSP